MSIPKTVLKEVLSLPSRSRVELVDQLLHSLDKPDKEIDALWEEEAERRLDDYERGEIKAVSLEEVVKKHR